MAPKHTNPKVANTKKMRYFSFGRNEAALLGPIMADISPPLEAGGISFQEFSLAEFPQLYFLHIFKKEICS